MVIAGTGCCPVVPSAVGNPRVVKRCLLGVWAWHGIVVVWHLHPCWLRVAMLTVLVVAWLDRELVLSIPLDAGVDPVSLCCLHRISVGSWLATNC